MPWLKQGDAAANHPIVLAAVEMEDADDRILNECFGFVGRCATQAAAYEQDYIITVGTARHMAGSLSRYNALIAAAKYCGYLTEVQVDIDGEQRKAFKLVEDNDLFHMILKAEREWNNQRKRDARNPELTVKVRIRDGDACRYCGKSVAWGDNKSGRGATYDHTNPGQGGTVDTMVVCCRECNGRRGDDPDSVWKTLPAPAEPLYGPATVAFIAKHGTAVQASYTRTPTTSAATVHPAATGGDGSSGRRGNGPSGLTSGDGNPAAAATVQPAATDDGLTPKSNPDPGHRSPGSRFVGTGRDGTGWSGRGGSGQEARKPPRQRKRKPRPPRPSKRGRN